MNRDEIRRWDKRRTAFHEAGHGVALLALGCPAVRLTLTPNNPNDFYRNNFYVGQCRALWPKQCKPGKLARATWACSGFITHLMNEYPDLDGAHALGLFIDQLESDSLSATDKNVFCALHRTWWSRAINLSVETLQMYWTPVRGLAFELHDNYRGEVLATRAVLRHREWRSLL
jgi:hypothetical protein